MSRRQYESMREHHINKAIILGAITKRGLVTKKKRKKRTETLRVVKSNAIIFVSRYCIPHIRFLFFAVLLLLCVFRYSRPEATFKRRFHWNS